MLDIMLGSAGEGKQAKIWSKIQIVEYSHPSDEDKKTLQIVKDYFARNGDIQPTMFEWLKLAEYHAQKRMLTMRGFMDAGI